MKLRLLAFILALLTVAVAGCQSGGDSLRLPAGTVAPQAPAGQAPAAKAAVQTPAPPAAGGNSGPAPVGQAVTPSFQVTPLPPPPTMSIQDLTPVVPLPTPLPVLGVIGGANDAMPLKRPVGLALTSSGGLYVTDQAGVHEFDASGKFVKTLIKTGSDTGLRLPSSVALAPGGDVYVADAATNTIFRVKPDGQVASKIGPATGVQLNQPVTVETDPQGDLFVVNQATAEVLKLDPSGKQLLKFGGQGEENGKFIRPRALALDKDGNIYVSDLSTFLIQKFNPQGQYVKTFGNQKMKDSLWLLRGMDVGPDNRLYALDGGNSRIQVFNLGDLSVVKEFENPGREPGQFFETEDLRVDGQGNVYIVDKGNNRVQKLKLPF